MTGFVARESKATGRLGMSFYSRYLLSMRSIAWMGPVLLFLIVAENFFANGFRWLVSLWVEACGNHACTKGPWIEVPVREFFAEVSPQRSLFALLWFVLFAVVFRAFTWTVVTAFLARGGRSLHDEVVHNLSHVPVTFYDENPTGRIVRRFSGDYANLLVEIPNYVNDIFGCIAEIVWIFLLVAFQAPLACASCLPCALVYLRIQSDFRPASREVQRLAKILETPIWAVFTESVAGQQTIRAYGRSDEFQKRLQYLQNRYAYAFLTQNRMTRWLNVRLKMTSEMFGLIVTLFVIWSLATGRLGAGVAGFLMSLSIGLDGTMQWLTRSFSMIDSTMVSLERILEYRNLPREGLRQGGSLQQSTHLPESPETAQPAISGAEIRFHDLSARYREGLPVVLNNVQLTIPARSRVGIIGRTGAGKSTLFQALYRMLEVESGNISVNGSSLLLKELSEARSLFSIVPQEPHLFAGTLRHNLDRLGKHSEKRLWEALEAVRLAEHFRAQGEAGLDFEIIERGGNLSVGQRQLICFARALLMDAPIVLMDEPTASVDLETDAAIQMAVKHLFQGKTVIVIAHRLETVQDCDLVLVMSQGRLVAQGAPDSILPAWMSGVESGSMLA
ncbi:MAG: ATP-binding cassette domain-containing protein [Betaproteobacteria bacterium]|nr:ATP-binding cassette domain-containing protein [Betaproteobacteria bacterium]